jgi:hypothetical protein
MPYRNRITTTRERIIAAEVRKVELRQAERALRGCAWVGATT